MKKPTNISRREFLGKATAVTAVTALGATYVQASYGTPSSLYYVEAAPIWYERHSCLKLMEDENHPGYEQTEAAVLAAEAAADFILPADAYANSVEHTVVRSTLCAGQPSSNRIMNSYEARVIAVVRNGQTRYLPAVFIRTIKFSSKPDGLNGSTLPSNSDAFNELWDK